VFRHRLPTLVVGLALGFLAAPLQAQSPRYRYGTPTSEPAYLFLPTDPGSRVPIGAEHFSPYMDWDYQGVLDDFFTPYFDGIDDLSGPLRRYAADELYAPYYVLKPRTPTDYDNPHDDPLHNWELRDGPYRQDYHMAPQHFVRPYYFGAYDDPLWVDGAFGNDK
jgi:hypothetical protein